ncbi:serine/threonine protein kinase [Paenibacillus sp. JSM ZJ436]|uniref:serine/threonine protein kinase n=1 Tax=Paenibacillus sp. JSM ZJ436 TaxID=3376190 RepID=UPI0037B0C477
MRLFHRMREFMMAWRDYPLQPGSMLHERYQVMSLLGEGSYGLTYLCHDQDSGNQVAVKQSRRSKGSSSRLLLQREARMLRLLHHPRIPAYLDCFQAERCAFMVMTYLEGRTLEELIFEQGHTYGEAECFSLAQQLLELAVHVHDCGFVHLDLRIPNVIIQGDELYLIDFGLSRQVGEELPSINQKHRPAFWRKPAAATGSKVVDETSDLEDIGHFMLFMLYSSYEPDNGMTDEECSWREELDLSTQMRQFLDSLFGHSHPFSNSREALAAIRQRQS